MSDCSAWNHKGSLKWSQWLWISVLPVRCLYTLSFIAYYAVCTFSLWWHLRAWNESWLVEVSETAKDIANARALYMYCAHQAVTKRSQAYWFSHMIIDLLTLFPSNTGLLVSSGKRRRKLNRFKASKQEYFMQGFKILKTQRPDREDHDYLWQWQGSYKFHNLVDHNDPRSLHACVHVFVGLCLFILQKLCIAVVLLMFSLNYYQHVWYMQVVFVRMID